MKVLVFGTFDQLHPGHIFFLNTAQSRGELFVVIARDTNVKKIKGHLAMQSQVVRMAAVAKAVPTARVLLGDPKDFLAPVRAVSPDLIMLGYDQRLPPGVKEEDLPCSVERMEALRPDKYKSSLFRYFPPPAGEG